MIGMVPDTMRATARGCQRATSRYGQKLLAGKIPHMISERQIDRAALLERIETRLSELGLSETEAAKRSGLGKDAIRDIRRRPKASPQISTIRGLATGLAVRPEWLAFGVGEKLDPQQSEPEGAPVIGEVAAGHWREVDTSNVDEACYELVPVPPDTRWPRDAQYGLVVRGTSINKLASDGDILLCVDLMRAGIRYKNGDLVVVERHRDGGALKEVTAKRVVHNGDKVELWPESTDPRYQEPIVLDGATRQEGENARVIAIVAWIYKSTYPRK